MAETITFLAVSSNPEAGGIYKVELDAETGAMTAKLSVPCPYLNYVIRDAKRGLYYGTVSRIDPKDEAAGGGAVVFRDGEAPRLFPTGGMNSCHLALSPDGDYLYTAQYGDGTLSELPLAADGTPGKPRVLRHAGHGVLPRQAGPHAHFAGFSPDGKFLLNVDLGLDTVFLYPYQMGKGIADTPEQALVPPGEGPRHLVFSPSGTQVFVANELGSTVTNFSYIDGTVRAIETVPTILQEPVVTNWPGAIRLSPDGNWLFISNRGDDSVAAFRITANRLKLVRATGSGGHWPRDIAFTRDGKFLIAANERSGNLASFRYQPENGGLIPCGRTASIPTVLNCVME